MARAVERGARWLVDSAVATVRLVPDTRRSLVARRNAMAQRTAAHARHVAHVEAATPWHDPLPPPVAPPLTRGATPDAVARGIPGLASSAVAPGAPGAQGAPGAPGAPGPVGSFEPLGRRPWDALVRQPMPSEAPTPRRDGRRSATTGARSRRDPLDWIPKDAEPTPDPEWDDGVPVPLVVPFRVRARSGAVLLALTGVFGVVTATAVLVAVLMAVNALDSL